MALVNWGQFHQPTDTKRKCAGTQHLARKDAVQFTNKTVLNSTSALSLKLLPTFTLYTLRSMPVISA